MRANNRFSPPPVLPVLPVSLLILSSPPPLLPLSSLFSLSPSSPHPRFADHDLRYVYVTLRYVTFTAVDSSSRLLGKIPALSSQ